MAKYLYRLGRWAYRRRLIVITGWVILLAAALILGGLFRGPVSSKFSIPGTKAQEALDLLNKEFPQANGGTVRLIFAAPAGTALTDSGATKAITDTLAEAQKDPAVLAVLSPFQTGTVSQDKTIGYADVIYKMDAKDVTKESKTHILDTIEISRTVGIQTELGGSVEVSELKIGGIAEAGGVVFAFVVLAVAFASLLTAGLTIITALVGVGIGIMCVFFGSNFFSMTSTGTILALMLGLAVGIDYALFMISRHRQQLADGLSIEESVARANATAGSAVIFAGLTVVIALAGLSVVNIPFLTVMGLAGAFTVLIAVLIAVTLIPAILGVAGKRVSPLRKAESAGKGQAAPGKTPFAFRWAKIVTKHPLPVLLAGVILLGAIALPALHMELGLPDNGTKSKDTTERRGYDLLSKGFGPGFNGPLVVVLRVDDPQQLQSQAAVLTEHLKALPNVAFVAPPTPNQTGKLAIVSLTPLTGPNDKATKSLVDAIRDKAEEISKDGKTQWMVTGSTAVNIDISGRLNGAFPVFSLVIVGLALVLMALVFRSVLVPVKAVLGFLLSIVASLGAVVFIFQDGHLAKLFGVAHAGPILNFLPVLLTGVLFGLAMDYEVFLVSRMREDYTHNGDARQAVITGVGLSGRVVTAAGLIMIFVFGSFIFAEDPMIKAMGLALTFGVLVDAFLVRMTLVPAVMTLLGRSAWFLPRSLDRVMPNVDIEGHAVLKELESREGSKA